MCWMAGTLVANLLGQTAHANDNSIVAVSDVQGGMVDNPSQSYLYQRQSVFLGHGLHNGQGVES